MIKESAINTITELAILILEGVLGIEPRGG